MHMARMSLKSILHPTSAFLSYLEQDNSEEANRDNNSVSKGAAKILSL